MCMFEKVIYISHPFQNKTENKDKIEDIIKTLTVKYPKYLFLSPVHSFGYLYNTVDYQIGIDYCLWLLGKADEMWVFGDYKNSRGCLIEIKCAEESGIPYFIKERGDENDKKYDYNS